jgi:hypothetical protein
MAQTLLRNIPVRGTVHWIMHMWRGELRRQHKASTLIVGLKSDGSNYITYYSCTWYCSLNNAHVTWRAEESAACIFQHFLRRGAQNLSHIFIRECCHGTLFSLICGIQRNIRYTLVNLGETKDVFLLFFGAFLSYNLVSLFIVCFRSFTRR